MSVMPKVKPVLRLVPNGVVDGRLRMTLIATPVAAEDGFELNKWPREVRDRIAPPAPGQPNGSGDTVSILGSDKSDGGSLRPARLLQTPYPDWFQTQLDEAWAAIVPTGDADLWTKLLNTIHRSLASLTFKNDLGADAPSKDVALDSEGSYDPQKALNPGQQLTVKAVLPVKHGDLALLLEFERAKRVCDLVAGRVQQRRKAPGGLSDRSDDDASALVVTSSSAADIEAKRKEKNKADGDEYAKQVVAKKLTELQKAFDALSEERKKSAADVCATLSKPDLAKVAEDSDARATALATHTAATWQQKASEQSSSELDGIVQCYQAILSTPAWSRFFGFAFDLELVQQGDMPAWISAGDYPVTFKLDEKDKQPKSVGRAWTAVDGGGWPRPDGRDGLSQGLFLMGIDCAGGSAMPRYDLVTLDIRHATEALVRPVGGNGADKRGFLTAGMTLIDRRRAEDVRAQVWRTSTEKDKERIELYAQDLVVGRRLDAGIKTENGIAWRALGGRIVDYGFRRADAAGPDDFAAIESSITDGALQQGQAAGIRTLEEAILSPSARLTPSPGGDAALDKDVFVDEAFATWKGAPMGVDTAPKVGAGDKRTLVTFLQRQSLPSAGANAVALAPPLRYGRSYRFGMRAVFLGGHSRSIEDAAALYEKPTQDFTYPRDPSKEKQAPMRRFLRQEAIGSPVTLLPGSVLGAKIDEMDFGNVQSAVLRSLPLGYVAPKLPPKLRGRPYVPAAERVTPEEIVRILVPPQVALDQLLRSGVFDSAKGREDVALGGLRSIAFGVPEPQEKTKEVLDAITAQGNFPIAMIDEQRAFGRGPTRRNLLPGLSRPPAAKDRPAVRGAAIFIGRKAFKASGGPALTPRPYYPDPHARQLILRLRRHGDGSYVGAAAKVDVYDEIASYPNAMPTVVVVRKAKSDSAQAVIGLPTTIRTDGISPTGKNGERAQRVEITLARGEDLELEAFYLPGDKDSLATHFALTEMIGAYKLALKGAGGNAGGDVADHVTTGFFDVPTDDELRVLAGDLVNFACGEGACAGAGGPIEELSGICSMRVAHAVNKPLAPPSFPERKASRPIYRKAFDTSKYVHKFALDPDFDGIPPPANLSPDAEARHTPSGLGPTEMTLAELERIRAADLRNSTGTHSYVLSGRVTFDRRTTSAIEILASCISPREVLIDDPARRRPPKARVSGAWPMRTAVVDENGKSIPPERRPAEDVEVYGFRKINVKTGAVTLQSSEVVLLRIDNIALPGTGPLMPDPPNGSEGTIDLSLAHIAAQIGKGVTNASGDLLFRASQLHVFPDGKARRLRLRLRAISRFGPDFETAARWTGADGISQPVVRLRQPLLAAEQSVDSAPPETPFDDAQAEAAGQTVTVWLPSSSRPAKCALLSPVPVFRFIPGTEGTASFTKRLRGVRIYLERGWFSSGEGERLGVVLLPADETARYGNEFLPDDRFGPIGRYVTRWGGDPIREDHAPLTTSLTDASFVYRPGETPSLVRNIAVPVQIPKPPGAKDNVTILEAADLLTYEPRFDVDREQWFVDLDVQAPEAPNLFVRFGLVRFQENAIHEDLRASEPIVVWSQLLPQRTLTASVDMQAAGSAPAAVKVTITATVAGPSHKGSRIPQKPDSKKIPAVDLGRLHSPTVRFRLMHESSESGDLRRVVMGIGEALLSSVKNSHAESTCTFDVMKADIDALGPGVAYIYAEEIETFMPAAYAKEPAHVEEIFMPKTFVESGPRFAARLNLQDFIDFGGS